MQLDFLGKLLRRLTPPSAPAKPSLTPRQVPRTAPLGGSDPILLARAQALLQQVNCPELASRLTVRWNPRMRSTAGTAHCGKCLVNLNPQLQQFGEAEVDGTLRHELAHLLAQHRAGRRRIAPHGPEWRRACEDLGLKDEKRCHDLPLARRQLARRHHYRCPACGVEMRRVRPLRRRSACLACCRRHNGGRYDDRFRFVPVRP